MADVIISRPFSQILGQIKENIKSVVIVREELIDNLLPKSILPTVLLPLSSLVLLRSLYFNSLFALSL